MVEGLTRFFVPSYSNLSSREPTCTDALLAQTPEVMDDDDFYKEYIQRQKRNLIEEAARVREEEKKNFWLCFGGWTVLFGLLMTGVVLLATRRNIPAEIKEVIDQNLDSNVQNWKANMGDSECRKLSKESLMFHGDVKSENMSSLTFKSPAVFFMKDEADLTMEEACGLESFVRLLAELMVYAVRLKCKKSGAGIPTNKYKTILTDTYKNFQAINVDGKKFFKGSPLSGRWTCGSDLAVQQALLVAAWRFGGLAVHPGIAITQRSFINFKAGEIHISANYVASYTKCSPSVYYLLTIMGHQPKAETAFDVSKNAKAIFDALCCAGICPDVIADDSNKVCDENCPLTLVKNISQLSKFCPKIWKALDDSLRTES